MLQIIKNLKIKSGLMLVASSFLLLQSCNKEFDDAGGEIPAISVGTTPTLATLLDAPDMTIFKAAVTKAGLMSSLSNTSLQFTVFAPNDAAMTASGISSVAVINALPLTTIVPLVKYHIVPQKLVSANITTTFPNLQYPTLFNPAPSVSAFLRLTTFPSKRNGAWVNNIPVTAEDIMAVNGVMHKVALVVAPPSRFVYDRINTDNDLSIFKAAIARADSGVVATNPSSLIGAMNNIGASLTVFAPNNQAFKNLISALTGGAVPNNAPDNTYIGFIGSNNVTTQTVKGIVVYHIMPSRAFTNNFPVSAATSYPTLLNSVVASHPGIGLIGTFTGPFISAASVKGIANGSASNILINPTPDPNGSSDQHYLNGTIHKIDQVLLPQ